VACPCRPGIPCARCGAPSRRPSARRHRGEGAPPARRRRADVQRDGAPHRAQGILAGKDMAPPRLLRGTTWCSATWSTAGSRHAPPAVRPARVELRTPRTCPAAPRRVIRNMYVENASHTTGTKHWGAARRVEIDTDTYIVAGVDDHIVPWRVSYRTTQLFKGRCARDDVGWPHRRHRLSPGAEGPGVDQPTCSRPTPTSGAPRGRTPGHVWNDWSACWRPGPAGGSHHHRSQRRPSGARRRARHLTCRAELSARRVTRAARAAPLSATSRDLQVAPETERRACFWSVVQTAVRAMAASCRPGRRRRPRRRGAPRARAGCRRRG